MKHKYPNIESNRTRIRIRHTYKVTLYGFWAIVFYLHIMAYVLLFLKFLLIDLLQVI